MKFRHCMPLLAGLLAWATQATATTEVKLQALPAAGDANHAPVAETRGQRDARMAWWREAKFGMFIHYGLYSGLGGNFQGREGGGEWLQKNLELDTNTYAKEALPRFVPAPGCTDAWAQLAREAGCRYMVMTSKHHDGFALWDTELTDYSSARHQGRDLVREFTDSARAQGMRVGLYHSVIDWHHPDYDNSICPDLCYPKGQEAWLRELGIPRDQAAYQEFLHGQVEELLGGRYGTIDIIWWDYSQGAAEGERAWRAPALIEMCRRLNPGIIMNNRLYSFSGFDPSLDRLQLDLRCGDYTTPEKRIPEAGYPGIDWESCMTVGRRWGYHRYDHLELKSPATIIRQLEQCAARGGNLLLNINPKADGSVPEGTADVFRRVGAWMKVNGEAIYGSRTLTWVTMPENCMCSQVEEDMYVFLPVQAPADGADYVLRLRATQIDAVRPSILGQPGLKLKMERIEEPGKDEPLGILCITIPAAAWQDAVEGMPVLKLANDY